MNSPVPLTKLEKEIMVALLRNAVDVRRQFIRDAIALIKKLKQ